MPERPPAGPTTDNPPGVASADRRPRRLPLVLILGSLTALGPLTIDLYLPALPQVSADLHVSQAVTQLTLTAFMIGTAVGQLVIGPLSDTLGRRRPLVAGLAVYVVAGAVCALAPGPATLITMRLVQGLTALLCAGTALILLVTTTHADLPWIAAALFLTACPVGMILPTTTALCLQRAPHTAGSASALVGTTQFLMGALAPALTGLGGQRTALAMATSVLGLALAATGCWILLSLRR
ncbi:MFS transporter [Streptomyces purpurascens]|uniref:MFS transporter n=1 Tax=Streptomyces purpurascens TaxID=1924 RepID=UPI001674BF05|nr:MFS transporter [Streptomyces purpurascens]MCE7052265.1 MFS transporter [Streptomyces purpurascens]GHA55755.1 hypothetical protein GCM10010303_79520 [Streptomyces purpurascens]